MNFKARLPFLRLARDTRGNVAMTFAMAALPTIVAIGMAVDYGYAISQRTELQSATDSAALAGAMASPGTLANVTDQATKVFNSHAFRGPTTLTVTQPGTGQVSVAGTMSLDTSFLRLINVNSITLNAISETRAFSAGAIEVSLVLDNTGSMVNDMPALKQAATALTNSLFTSAAGNPGVRMSIVPFVASVNPGRAVLEGAGGSMLDVDGRSRWHGAPLNWAAAATQAGCTPNWGGGSGGVVANPGTGGKGASLDTLESARRFARALFGVAEAQALAAPGVTPNTVFPLGGSFSGPKGEFLPTGFTISTGGGCDYLYNPATVSVADLYARIPKTTSTGAAWNGWKGCVLARANLRDGAAKDYDVTDEPPNAGDANSLFTPYFSADEPDDNFAVWSGVYNNNYLPDGALSGGVVADDPTLRGSWTFSTDTYLRAVNLFKYNSVNKPTIVETAPDTKGPNRACPDEVLPLTSDKSTVLNKIASLNYWNGGGTIVSEGLVWGWRTLSPNLPYATALPYTPTNQKVVVLMSDGKNEIAENGRNSSGDISGSPIYSDFSAYGYLRYGRFPDETFSGGVAYLDDRLRTACANAKAKGVMIYTVLFRETDPTAVNNLRACASAPDKAFTAANGADLAAAFGAIGSSISKLRLVK
ncbi:MAG: pilus assembly protein [Rhizobiales bacterium]|nr:pilus assembly protein [Hyphomicrobiales bacterium]